MHEIQYTMCNVRRYASIYSILYHNLCGSLLSKGVSHYTSSIGNNVRKCLLENDFLAS